MSQASIEVVSIGFVLKQRKESLKGLFHCANNSHIHAGATANLLAANVDLDDFRVFWIKLLVWKVAAKHQQRVTVHHRLITGCEPEKSGHSDVVGIVILDEFFSTQRVDDGSLELFRDPKQLRACSGAARAAKDGDCPGLIQRFRRLFPRFLRRTAWLTLNDQGRERVTGSYSALVRCPRE